MWLIVVGTNFLVAKPNHSSCPQSASERETVERISRLPAGPEPRGREGQSEREREGGGEETDGKGERGGRK